MREEEGAPVSEEGDSEECHLPLKQVTEQLSFRSSDPIKADTTISVSAARKLELDSREVGSLHFNYTIVLSFLARRGQAAATK